MSTSVLWLSLGFTFLALSLTQNNNSTSSDVHTSVGRVLLDQQEAWNRHDLEGFMAGYWKSPELTFFSGAQRTQGWQGALDRYRRVYQSEGKEMGQLGFSQLQIESLATDAGIFPCRISLPNAVSTSRWIVRLSGRAP